MTTFRLAIIALFALNASATAAPPNVLVVISDDQGFGDLGVHGNPVLKTPHLDAFTKQSAFLKNFYASPVCSPTRSALLTGLYNYRTGVVDTYLGRSMMRPDVLTLPAMLKAAGYRTGIFGKWHLGDNYPLRPEDRGFDETLWLRGGGLAQPSDSPEADPKTAYFDPVLTRNGKEVKTTGYCSNVFTDAAIRFLKADPDKPFFAYVAFNAPHAPFQVPPADAAPYRKLDLSANAFPKVGQRWDVGKLNPEDVANAYGMIANLDANFGRLMKALDEAKLAENTVVVFLTDNGPGGLRFNAGLRNRKGTVYEGGVRVPCYVRWPGKVPAGHVVDVPTAHIDLTPTLVTLCHVERDGKHTPFDGRDLAKVLAGEAVKWESRFLFAQWHRGDVPEKGRAFMARGPRYKLVQAAGVLPAAKWTPRYELFDLTNDPFEQTDLAEKLPDEAALLKREYETWFADVTKLGFTPPRIVLGSEKENPARLSRQDWRGDKAGWTADSVGHWEVAFEQAGKYEVTFRSGRPFSACDLKVDYVEPRKTITRGGGFNPTGGKLPTAKSFALQLTLDAGEARLDATVRGGKETWGVDHVEVKYLGK